MCKKLRIFAKKGQQFAETLPPDFLSKIEESMISYQNLMVPPKILGGYCPCLKPARSGPEYDKKLMTVKAKMVSTLFLCQAVIIESEAEHHNMQSMHFSDFSNKMNSIFSALSEIKCTGNDRSLENSRKKLLPCIVSIEKFILTFEEDFIGSSFQTEAPRRLKSAQELLVSRQQPNQSEGASVAIPVSKRVLVKALSSLQEIMNSAASISSSKAKEHLMKLDTLMSELKKVRDYEVAVFNQLEDGMHENNLMDMLHRLREDSEIVHSDTSSKLRDAMKRWSSVKTQSVPRKVVEYEDENESLYGTNNGKQLIPSLAPASLGEINMDPSKLVKNTAMKFNNVGQLAFGVVHGAASVVQVAASEVGTLATHSASMASKGANTAVSKATKSANNLLGIDQPGSESPAVSHHGSNTNSSSVKHQKSGFAKFNPIDSIMDGIDSMSNSSSHSQPAPVKKSTMGTIFNSLDAF